MHKRFVSAAVLGVAFASIGVATAFAQSIIPTYQDLIISQNGNGTMHGIISSVSGNIISVKNWGGVWNVDLSHAVVTSWRSLPASPSDFMSGDFVSLAGKFSTTSTNVVGSSTINYSFDNLPRHYSGKITGVTSQSKVTILAKAGTYTVNILPTTSVSSKNAVGVTVPFSVGMSFNVDGALSRPAANTINAMTVVAFSAATTPTH